MQFQGQRLVSLFVSGVLLLLVVVSVAHADVQCKQTDKNAIIGQKFKLKPPTLGSSGVKRDISGTLQVVNGCDFKVSNFSMYPPCSGSFWYGVPVGQAEGELLPRVVTAPIGSFNGQTATFTLTGFSWSEMDGVVVYCENERKIIAKSFWTVDKSDEEDSSNDGSSKFTLALTGLAWITALLASAFVGLV